MEDRKGKSHWSNCLVGKRLQWHIFQQFSFFLGNLLSISYVLSIRTNRVIHTCPKSRLLEDFFCKVNIFKTFQLSDNLFIYLLSYWMILSGDSQQIMNNSFLSSTSWHEQRLQMLSEANGNRSLAITILLAHRLMIMIVTDLLRTNMIWRPLSLIFEIKLKECIGCGFEAPKLNQNLSK